MAKPGIFFLKNFDQMSLFFRPIGFSINWLRRPILYIYALIVRDVENPFSKSKKIFKKEDSEKGKPQNF